LSRRARGGRARQAAAAAAAVEEEKRVQEEERQKADHLQRALSAKKARLPAEPAQGDDVVTVMVRTARTPRDTMNRWKHRVLSPRMRGWFHVVRASPDKVFVVRARPQRAPPLAGRFAWLMMRCSACVCVVCGVWPGRCACPMARA